MATAPKTLGRRKGKGQENRPSAFRRGYSTERYRKMRLAYVQQIIDKTGDLICGICGKSMASERDYNITIDHIVAPSRMGAIGSVAYDRYFYDTSNWQIAHRSCNSAKQDAM